MSTKKLLSILLSVVIAVGLLTFGAVAAGNYDSSTPEPWLNDTTGISYYTFSDAVSAASAGDTIRLTEDVTEDITIPSSASVTIDLNTYTLTNVSSDTITVANGATLTITGSGTVDNVTHQKAAIANNGTVVLNGGTYTRSSENGSSNTYYTILNHGTMTINSGVTASNISGFSSMLENGYYDYTSGNERTGYVAGTNSQYPTLTINGGTFSGGINTIKNDDNGILYINGGTFTNYTQASVQNHNTATITGGTFIADSYYAVLNCGCVDGTDEGILTITGGTFSGGYAVFDESTVDAATITITGGTFSGGYAVFNESTVDAATITITGGTYSSDVPDEYIVTGLDAVKLSSGYWIIGTRSDISFSSTETNGNAYIVDSLTSAISGQTVTITAIPESSYYKAVVTVINDTTGLEVTVTPGSNNTYTFTMPESSVTISVRFVRVKDEISGIFYVNESYHGIMVNGHLLSIPHTVNEAGYCTTCGAYIGVEEEEVDLEEEVTEEVVEVEDPVESGETDSEDDGEEAPAETPSEEETNPTTGVALGLVPMAVAALTVAVSKKH